MVDITLFELHLPDASFNAPFSGSAPDAAETEDETSIDVSGSDDAESESSGGSPGGAIAALLVMAGIALVAWYVRGGDASEEDELEIE